MKKEKSSSSELVGMLFTAPPKVSLRQAVERADVIEARKSSYASMFFNVVKAAETFTEKLDKALNSQMKL